MTFYPFVLGKVTKSPWKGRKRKSYLILQSVLAYDSSGREVKFICFHLQWVCNTVVYQQEKENPTLA